ncbi:hypothetical protein [uncultured Cytophaga sp.]|uniref:hypothetical protein n=1 Tax=uncultured Cytophaga sp. TaxID=160238 RepID=UPI00262A47C0|nr:hypothetical protein [uncultured Cytophaga sp.]
MDRKLLIYILTNPINFLICHQIYSISKLYKKYNLEIKDKKGKGYELRSTSDDWILILYFTVNIFSLIALAQWAFNYGLFDFFYQYDFDYIYYTILVLYSILIVKIIIMDASKAMYYKSLIRFFRVYRYKEFTIPSHFKFYKRMTFVILIIEIILFKVIL